MEELDDYTAPCQQCNRTRYLIDERRDLARARICDHCFDVCPACEGQEYRYELNEQGYEVARHCPVCGDLKRRIRAFNDARLPRRHSSATFETFQVTRRADGSTSEPLGNLQRVRFRLFNWVRGFTPGDQGFLLHGKVGTGKTHLLAATIRNLTLELGIPVRFVEFTHLLSDLRQQFDQGRGEAAILAPLIELPVLAIDELGKGRNTEWQLSIIDEIISKRYNRSLTTLFTTNYPVREIDLATRDGGDGSFRRTATSETLRERVGERVFSRLYEMAEFIEIEAPDFRKTATS